MPAAATDEQRSLGCQRLEWHNAALDTPTA